ncbi:ABC transporter ATP-binding protein [Salipiger thiooxidans]|jgi:putative spermidine/putrescine transport system ATP-binding protein|uniref:ABC transporter ATP-binding protein n=1 Tax=Salipiger thiooxidans TaxID=282683 RepID=UPI001A8BF540|nr:ABC transporter ATP-binding protein [Salipiger thiooxidans]MBN8190152.1 ABC transporter ATP-binding protein [Salipiger thiooxidans]MBR9841352.1 ABC transporter ATP-binding protein [Paracoccaceae bacterium]MCA0849814.1 ABC transporter ATP-binding protein [Salipiger thiooxidans]
MHAPNQHSIRIEGLSKDFGLASALKPTTLTVESGEFLTLLGPSGSGKSTLLNLISGAISPTEGRIYLDGRDLTNVPPRDRGIGMVFQNYALMPHMTVFDNVAYPLRIRKESASEIRRKVGEALERVGLSGFEARKPRQLSGGQQQRVGIARCIVYSPAIIMMDEPLGALDKNLREQMQGEIKRLHNDLGTTFIYVTHDQEEALNMSDRICLMSMGEVAQLGTPDDLYFRPNSKYVAGFIGESNILEGRVASPTGITLASGDDIRVPAIDAPQGSEIAAMVRPERLRVVAPGAPAGGPGENHVSGTVEEIAFVGGTTRLGVDVGGRFKLIAATISERLEHRPAIGERISLAWNAADSVALYR